MQEPKIESFIMAEHFTALKDTDAKAILDHAEKQLKDTIDTSALIVARLTTLVTIVTAFMVGLLGYAVTRGITAGFKDRYVITAFFGIGYLYIPAVLIVWNFLSKSYYILGSEPKDFFVPKIFTDNKGDELKAIYCYEIMEIQMRINANKAKNNWRWNMFNIALIMILLSPVVLYLIYRFIPPCLSSC